MTLQRDLRRQVAYCQVAYYQEKLNAETGRFRWPSNSDVTERSRNSDHACLQCAPRLVFDAWTQPEQVKRWFGGCSSTTLTVCEIDLHVGGLWRYVLHDISNGIDHGFSGEYREILPPERLVFTERYEPVPGSDHLNILTLIPQDGKTMLRILVQHQSQEQRDGHLQSGMEEGLRETLNRLETLLEAIA